MLSVRLFIKEAWQALRADWQLMFPYLFLFGFGQMLFSDVLSPEQFSAADMKMWYFLGYWLIAGMFFKTWFLLYRNDQYLEKDADLWTSLQRVMPSFIRLLMYSFVVVLVPLLCGFLLVSSGLLTVFLNSFLGFVFGVFLYAIGLVFVVFVEVFQVLVVVKNMSFSASFFTVYKWIRQSFSLLSRTIVLAYFLGIMITMFSNIFVDIPGLGKGFFSVIFQSFGSVLKQLIIMACVFGLLKTPKIPVETVDVFVSEEDL